jgi:O-Antigen ligase
MALQASANVRTRSRGEVPALAPAARRTDAYRLARGLILVLLATAVDAWNYLDRGGWARYLLLLVPVAALVIIRLQNPSTLIRRPIGSDRVLLLLFLIGLPGAIFGILFRGTPATTLPVFAPMVVAFLYLGTLEEPTNGEARRILQAVEWVGILYITLAATVTAGLLPGIEFRQFRNASLLFVALGIASTVTLRHWVRALYMVALWGVVFVFYPSATSVLIALTISFTLLMMPLPPSRARPSRLRPYLLAIIGATAVILAVLNISRGVEVTGDYFALVGKANANSGRLAVWSEGIDRFQDSPLVGEVFSGSTVTTAVREGSASEFQLPYHNDYIHFLANGGLIGLGLLLLWIAMTEVLVLRSYTALLATGETSRAMLLRALLVGFNAFFVTAAFNPTLMGLSRAASIFSVYALMMMTLRHRSTVGTG